MNKIQILKLKFIPDGNILTGKADIKPALIIRNFSLSILPSAAGGLLWLLGIPLIWLF